MGGDARASSGVAPLDDILDGGFVEQRLHLIEGEPGTGKTTLGLQFLLAGRELGQKTLYITLSETAEELAGAAKPVELGGDSLLKKPYRVDTLAQSVQAALRRDEAPGPSTTNVVSLKPPGSAM
jgi:KaiC/GvpD/RAD55 family RecA-like ATPase